MASNSDGWEDVPVHASAPAQGDGGWEDVPVQHGAPAQPAYTSPLDQDRGAGTAAALHAANHIPFSNKMAAALQATQMKFQGSPFDWSENYQQALNNLGAMRNTADIQHPDASNAGAAGAEIANLTASIPFGGAAGAAGMGVIQGLGNSESLDRGDLGGAAKDAAYGAGGALALHGLVSGAGNLLANRAARNAFKAAGPMLKDTRAVGVEEIPNVGKRLLDMKGVKFGDSAENIGDRLGNMAGKTGEEIGALKQGIDAAGARYDPSQVSGAIEQDIVDPIRNSPALKGVAKEMQGYADDFRALGNPGAEVAPGATSVERAGRNPLSELAKERENFDDVIKFNQVQKTPQTSRLLQLRSLLDELYYRNANKVAPELAKEYAEKQADYAIQRPVAKMAQDMAERQAANLKYGLADRLVGAGVGAAMGGKEGGTPGALAGAAAGTLGSRLLRTRGPASAAVIQNLLSKGLNAAAPSIAGAAGSSFGHALGKVGSALTSNPAKLGIYGGALSKAAAQGPDALAAKHFVLSSDPQYQKHVETLPDAEEP